MSEQLKFEFVLDTERQSAERQYKVIKRLNIALGVSAVALTAGSVYEANIGNPITAGNLAGMAVLAAGGLIGSEYVRRHEDWEHLRPPDEETQ